MDKSKKQGNNEITQDINNLTNIELLSYIKTNGHTIKSFSKKTGIPIEILNEKLKNTSNSNDKYMFYGYEVEKTNKKTIEMFEILDSILYLCELYY